MDNNSRLKNPKPKYNVPQNTAYILKNAWKNDKSVPALMLAYAVLTPAVATVAMYLPKTAVGLILGGADAGRLIFTVLAFTAAAVLLQIVLQYIDATKQLNRVGMRIGVCMDILRKALSADYANLEQKAFTDAKRKANNYTQSNNQSTEQVYYVMERIAANVLGFVVYVALLVSINPLILLLTASTTVIGFLMRRRANLWRHANDDEQAGYAKRLWYLSELGAKTALAKDIRLFAMGGWLRDVYESFQKLRFDWEKRAQGKQLLADLTDSAAALLREGAAYAYLVWLVLFRGLPIDRFVLLFAAIGGFSAWIAGILENYAVLQQYSLEYCRLREYLEYPDTFRHAGGLTAPAREGGDYTLEMRGVSFRYPGAENNVLEDVNLTVRAGEKLAVVGLNGAGKTTLVKLLCGFYDPTRGQVLLNGQDIRDYDRDSYYGLFMAVFQEFNILPVTIAENVAQCPADEADPEKTARCIEMAGLTEKVASLPDGAGSLLKKDIHDDAVELSGGEIQRLMLARALYKDAGILILDEPTAALDPIAESNLYERYNELSAGKTSLYISHRLASTRFCDRIILLDGKRIAEEGAHDELIRNGKKYAELFEIQSRYYQKEVEII